MSYINFTPEEKARAQRADLLAYIRKRGYPLKEYAKGYYKIPGYGGLLIKPEKNCWYWESRGKGGGAIQFCMEVEKKSWAEAVEAALSVDTVSVAVADRRESGRAEEKDFRLPPRNDTYRQIFAYLVNARGIDRTVVQRTVTEHKLYEDTRGNCVFVGYDELGLARFACLRGTADALHRPFKGDVAGSRKQYPFCVEGRTDTLYVFEAPIDLLSYMTLQIEQGTDDHYVSLSGISLIGLDGYLSRHPEVSGIVCCTDNDTAGDGAAEQIRTTYGSAYDVSRLSPAPYKDFNERLCREKFLQRMTEITKNR